MSQPDKFYPSIPSTYPHRRPRELNSNQASIASWKATSSERVSSAKTMSTQSRPLDSLRPLNENSILEDRRVQYKMGAYKQLDKQLYVTIKTCSSYILRLDLVGRNLRLSNAMYALLPSKPLFICNTNNSLALDMSRLLQLESFDNAFCCKWEGTSRINARRYETLGNKLKDSTQVLSI